VRELLAELLIFEPERRALTSGGSDKHLGLAGCKFCGDDRIKFPVVRVDWL
jgi:hypothetical protein